MSGMSSGDITTLTGNAGGLIPATGSGNFNIVGSGGILVTGNPATHTLTISGGAVVAITNHALAVGTGVTITSLGVGTTGTILTGVSGADPTWTTATRRPSCRSPPPAALAPAWATSPSWAETSRLRCGRTCRLPQRRTRHGRWPAAA